MIEINNLTADLIDEEFFKGVAKIVLKGENKKDALLSIALVGQKKIRELNKKYRGKNSPTDVLSFGDNMAGGIENITERGELNLGEILICPQEVKKNAKKYGLTFKKELARVLIHGILHLFRYEHEENKRSAEKMRKKEEIYFSKIKKLNFKI